MVRNKMHQACNQKFKNSNNVIKKIKIKYVVTPSNEQISPVICEEAAEEWGLYRRSQSSESAG